MLNIFIVHYSKLKDRKEFIDYQISQNLSRYYFNYEYILPYDKESLSKEIIEEFYEKSVNTYKEKTKNLWEPRDCNYKELTDAEISCQLKHILAMKKASKCSDISLIIEDDCCFQDNFFERLSDITSIANLPKDWDVIFLGSGCGDWFQKIKIKNSIKFSENLYRIKHPASNCTECYLVNPKSAKKIFDNWIPFHLSADFEMAYIFYKLDMDIYWAYPSLADQGSKNGMYRSELR